MPASTADERLRRKLSLLDFILEKGNLYT